VSSVILLRRGIGPNEEEIAASTHFPVRLNRSDVRPGELVIPRYSALPYYEELEYDCPGQLVNTSSQMRWITDFDYYDSVKDYTPTTYDDYNFWSAPEGVYVVKGRTNSRKQRWNKDFYAPTKRKALEIASELANDSLIGRQGIIYRNYVPLKTFEVDPIYGCPISNEWRFFYLHGRLVTYGYYWSTATNPELGTIDQAGIDFAAQIAKIAAEHNNFFALDIAEMASGGWMLVEINAGEQAGLSCIEPEDFYGRLKAALP